MKNTETLHRTSESLARAQQVSAETGNNHTTLDSQSSLRSSPCHSWGPYLDQVADGIMVDLEGQKESLLRTRNRVSASHSWLLFQLLFLPAGERVR